MNEIFVAGFKLGLLVGNVRLLFAILLICLIFYALLFAYVAYENKMLKRFLREKKLLQAWADHKASGKAGKFWQHFGDD